MKKVISFTAFLLTGNLLYSQLKTENAGLLQTGKNHNLESKIAVDRNFDTQTSVPFAIDYNKRSRTQKTFAWILTGVGATVILFGILTQPYVDGFADAAGEKNTSKYVMYGVGGACVASGIILFVASSKNKKRAASSSVYLDMENSVALKAGSDYNKAYPVLGFRLSLK